MKLFRRFLKNYKTPALIAGVVLIVWFLRDTISKGAKALFSLFGDKPFADFNGIFSAKAIAEQQLNAMYSFGTDEDSLFSSLRNLTPSQLEQVFKAFGTAPYMGFGQMAGSTELNLFGWYTNELTKAQRNQMREIWQVTKLAITF